jgi:hypothetical protein
VDYVGDVSQFAKEFNDDLAVIAFAIAEFGLPDNLKLSIHSGSDKFSIYGVIGDALRHSDAGVHIKTAGTTWLEELIGLAEGGGEGLAIAKEVYAQALEHKEALCEPYATVIDIDFARLPAAEEVNGWSGAEYAAALRHDASNPAYSLEAAAARRLQGGGEHGRALLRCAARLRIRRCPQRHGKPLGAAHQAAVSQQIINIGRQNEYQTR